ncbi:Uncharacterised protein [Serratia quinivorans]|nr:Uncharacterised protein [Serratia quinivorans]CAI1606326.1 Uncharacterised protein [Serratia quinivorans]
MLDGKYSPPKAINVTSSYPTVIDVQLLDGVGIVMSQAYPALKGDPGDSDVSGSVIGGNWASNTGSDFSSASAYLSANGVTTWKTTAMLSKVPNAQYQLVFSCSLQALPADANGVLLPYTLNALQSIVNAGAMAVVITLTVFGDATQLFDPTTGVYGPLGTVGEIAYDPKYTLNYWWKPTDANLLVLQEKLAEVR